MNIQTKIDDTKGRVAYHGDFALWALEQARLLGEGRFGALDMANLIDEVESLGRSQRTELRTRLGRLVEHLLKHRHGRMRDPASKWRQTIREQRRMIHDLVADSPSLKPMLAEVYESSWKTGVYEALKGFEEYESHNVEAYEREIPEEPDFSVEQALDEKFLPVPTNDE